MSDRVDEVDLLVVDGANVVGSRPDGWWKDRAGAAARLHRQLLEAVGPGLLAPRVVLVLEGRARGGVPEGVTSSIVVVHAPAAGDDQIVAEVSTAVSAGCGVAVVTADRELSARVEATGGRPLRPGWLLARLGGT